MSRTAKHEIRGKPALHDFFEDGGFGVLLVRGGRWTGAERGLEKGIPGEVAGEETGAEDDYIAEGGLH